MSLRNRVRDLLGRRVEPSLEIDSAGLTVVVEAFDPVEADSAALARSPGWDAARQAVLRHHLVLPANRVAEAAAILAQDGWELRRRDLSLGGGIGPSRRDLSRGGGIEPRRRDLSLGGGIEHRRRTPSRGGGIGPSKPGENAPDDDRTTVDEAKITVYALRAQRLDALHCAQERSRMAGLAQRLEGDSLGWDALQAPATE